jgi:hypothetical protein
MESLNKEIIIPILKSIFDLAEEIKADRYDLYKKTLNICDELENIFPQTDDYDWPLSNKELSANFDLPVSTIKSRKQNLKDKLQEGRDFSFVDIGKKKPVVCYEISGAIKILSLKPSEKASKWLRKQHDIHTFPKVERLYIDIIEYAVRGFDNPKKQFKPFKDNKYIIDLYLPRSKVAIECDENDHKHKDPLKESIREEAIKNELGCRFLRFNPDDSNFNIGEVINVIFSILTNRTLNGKDPIEYWNKLTGKRKPIDIPAFELWEFED